MTVVRCRALFDGARLHADAAVTLDGPRVVAVGPAGRHGPWCDGVVAPGLINSHLHLELSWLPDRVPGGAGLAAWVAALIAARSQASPDAARLVAAARSLRAAGVTGVCDVASDAGTAPLLAALGIGGVVAVEAIGIDRRGLPDRLTRLVPPHRVVGAATIDVRPTPHAPYSTAPALVAAALAARSPAPATVHLAEDADEALFLREGRGSFAEMLDAMGLDWRGVAPAVAGSVDWLDACGALGPHVVVVHGVHLDRADARRLATAGATVALCPRSNLHIGGRLPDVTALIDSGVGLALGTDSLGSSPDLDPLGEVPCLAAAFPDVSVVRWLTMATAGGAIALRAPAWGRVRAGTSPGLVHLETDDLETLRHKAPARRWIVDAGPPTH